MRQIRLIFMALIGAILIGCDKPGSVMAGFEKFAYEGCVKEGKYSNSICACNAANLDKALSDGEKQSYKKAALGDSDAVSKLFSIMDKLQGALKNCAK